MCEMEKDYQKIHADKFLRMCEKCPWRFEGRIEIKDRYLCMATYEICSIYTCAVWYFANQS
jgi:hypothetical protein